MRRVRLVAGLAVAATWAVAPLAASGAPALPQTPATPAGPAVPGPVPGTPDGLSGETMPTPTGPVTPTPPAEPAPPVEPTPSTQYVVWGCIARDATPAGAPIRVIWGNRDMRTALAGAGTFTVGIDAATSVRTGWSWQRRAPRAAHSRSKGVAGLRAGDIVTAFITARSGTAAAALPAADLILDFGRLRGSRSCAPRR